MTRNDKISNISPHIFEFAEFSFDASKKVLWRSGETVSLAPKACEILGVLIENAPQILSKEELMNRVWSDSFVEEANLTHHISALRKALGEDKNDRKFIETIPRKGYRFAAQIRQISDEPVEITVSERTTTQIVEEIILEEPNVLVTKSADEPKLLPGISSVQIKRETKAETNIQPRKLNWLKKRKVIPGLLAILLILGGGIALYIFLQRNAAPKDFKPGKVRRLTTSGRASAPNISPDGRYFLYLVRDGGQRSLRVQQVSTGSEIQIVPPTSLEDIYGGTAFSNNGDYVYYTLRKKGELRTVMYRVPTLGGTPQRILEDTASSLTFSPDGKQMAFLRSFPEQREFSLMIANADGTEQRKLATRQRPSHFNGHPAWSPDGKTILCPAVSVDGGFHYELLAVKTDNGEMSPVQTQPWQSVQSTVWLPDSKSVLVIAQSEDAAVNQIWHVSFPNGETSRVTNDSNGYGSLGITSDGQFLIVSKQEQESYLWLSSKDNQQDLRQITDGEDNYDGLNGIGWISNDKIAYASKASGKDSIMEIKIGDKKTRRLADDLGAGFTVSPNGEFIVFQDKAAGKQGLWRLDAKSGERIRLTEAVDNAPAISPDGKSVYFSRLDKQMNLWQVPLDGEGTARQITEDFFTVDSPKVSPDGKFIAVAYSKAKNPAVPSTGLAIINLENNEIIKAFEATFPFGGFYERSTLEWMPDGKSVCYIILKDGVSNIWQQPLDGAERTPLTNFKEGRLFNFAFAPDGKQIALSRGTVNSDVVLIENLLNSKSN